MGTYEYVKSYRQRQKENIIYVMGSKCVCCGYNRCNRALELHHLDPKEKDFTFSDNTNRAWDKIVSELPKTVLLCANCHRELHDGLIDNNELTTSFDKAKAQEISAKIEKSKKTLTKQCKICGKTISKYAKYCTDCFAKQRQIVERPSREQLKYDIRHMPMLQVGKKYGVTDNAIRKWCFKMNLPSKVSDIKIYTDEEWGLI